MKVAIPHCQVFAFLSDTCTVHLRYRCTGKLYVLDGCVVSRYDPDRLSLRIIAGRINDRTSCPDSYNREATGRPLADITRVVSGRINVDLVSRFRRCNCRAWPRIRLSRSDLECLAPCAGSAQTNCHRAEGYKRGQASRFQSNLPTRAW